jgi:hypothetical protein
VVDDATQRAHERVTDLAVGDGRVGTGRLEDPGLRADPNHGGQAADRRAGGDEVTVRGDGEDVFHFG